MIGPYEPLKTIGAGTFGCVKLVRKCDTSKLYAVKCICKNNILRSHMGAQVKMEIQAMKALDHPHVVKIKEVLISPLNLYVVMQYLPGGELFTKITKTGKLSIAQARKYTGHLVDALSYCHSKFICHRDIKPQNIMLDAHDNAVFVDFGFAKLMNTEQVSPEEDTIHNHSGTHHVLLESPENNTGVSEDFVTESLRTRELSTICGTKPFMAPEILTQKKYQGDKADVWSLGVVVYILLVGHLPFKSDDIERTFFTLPSKMPVSCADLVRKMLTHNPSQRPSASFLLQHEWLNQCSRTETRQHSNTSSSSCEDDDEEEEQQQEETVVKDEEKKDTREFTIPIGNWNIANLKLKLLEDGWRVQLTGDREIKISRVSSDGLVMVVITVHADSIHVVKKNLDENAGKQLFFALKTVLLR